MKFKPLNEQTVVITGATSGIGLVTARHLAQRGARLVLAARNEDALQKLVQELGPNALAVVTDVADEEQVKALGTAALKHFGGFDTWINNAGLAIYGRLEDVSTPDHRQLFDINFWGIVYGSLEAVRHFKTRPGEFAGNIINLGSVVSDRALPVQSMYSVSKHAVKGFTDALRMELEHDKAPISLTLIKPAAIATPFPQHARNYMDKEPSLPPPVYAPELVAEAILKCCEAPQRDILVGGAGKFMSMLGTWFPGLGDKLLKPVYEAQLREPSGHKRSDSLYQAGFGLQERGDIDQPVMEVSPYTAVAKSPLLKAGLLLGAGLGVALLADRKRAN